MHATENENLGRVENVLQRSNELINEMKETLDVLFKAHEKGVGKNVAAARRRARATTIDLEKKQKEYRKLSLELEKLLKPED
jgi:hypothetical protein